MLAAGRIASQDAYFALVFVALAFCPVTDFPDSCSGRGEVNWSRNTP
jgi:hypothetical protein